MTIKDIHGHALSGADANATEHYEAACALLRCYLNDPLAEAQAALAQAPDMTMAHVLVAYLNLLGTEPAGLPVAREAHAAAERCPATEREALHVAAAGALAHGQWHRAGRILEDLSIRHPQDLLALQVGHQIDFFTGQSRMLRDRIARAESHWHAGMPGRHAVLAMLAFGLEETADYARAEKLGRLSVELEPRDGWGWHAVAHVMEMQNRRREGIAWLTQDPSAWSEGSFFAGHNWWHLTLFHLGLDQIDEVMALLDERVLGSASPLVLDLIDGSALLWRLQLRGVPVGALGRAGLALGRGLRDQHLRLQRHARDDGLCQRRPHERCRETARRAEAGAGGRRRQRRFPQRRRPERDAGNPSLRVGPPRRGRGVAAPRTTGGCPFRRQSRAARPAGPDADRGRRTRG